MEDERWLRRLGVIVLYVGWLGDAEALGVCWESIGRALGERKGSLIIRLGDGGCVRCDP